MKPSEIQKHLIFLQLKECKGRITWFFHGLTNCISLSLRFIWLPSTSEVSLSSLNMTVHSSDAHEPRRQPVAGRLSSLLISCHKTRDRWMKPFQTPKYVRPATTHISKTHVEISHCEIRSAQRWRKASMVPCHRFVVSNTNLWHGKRHFLFGLLLHSISHCFITTCFAFLFSQQNPATLTQNLGQNTSNSQSLM